MLHCDSYICKYSIGYISGCVHAVVLFKQASQMLVFLTGLSISFTRHSSDSLLIPSVCY